MLIFYCSSRRFLLATRGHNKKWGEEASWKNLPTPLIFSFRKKKKNCKNTTKNGVAIFRCSKRRKLVMEKVVWSGFFERNKRVFSLLSGAWVCKNATSRRSSCEKRRKKILECEWANNDGSFLNVSGSSRPASLIVQERERPCCSWKKIYTGWTAIAPLLLCSSRLLLEAKADLH